MVIGANIDAVGTATQFGIEKDRAVNYNADAKGTRILYETVSQAVCNVRMSQPLENDWAKKDRRRF